MIDSTTERLALCTSLLNEFGAKSLPRYRSVVHPVCSAQTYRRRRKINDRARRVCVILPSSLGTIFRIRNSLCKKRRHFMTTLFIDIHPHIISADTARYPHSPLFGKQSDWSKERPVTPECLIAAMDEAGVAKAAIVQSSTCYGYDNSYVADTVAQFPSDRKSTRLNSSHSS